MNQQIKQRIEQIKRGKVPAGYKKTEFGVFPCDWETDKTFGDLFDFYGGLSKSREELGETGYAYLHYGDLHRGSFNVVSHQQYERLPKYDVKLKGNESYLMKDGDVAFLDASEDLEGTSRAVLIDNPENKPFIAGLHIIYGRPKENRIEKWYKQYITSTDSVKKQFQKLAVGFKVYGLNRDTLPKIQVAYPKSTDEQAKIAEILMKWGEAIDLYEKQIEKLKQYKSICLKKMFPAKGQTAPEWRFKGFTAPWERRKFSDLVETRRGLTYNPSNIREAGIRVLRSSNIAEDQFIYSEEDVFVEPEAANIPYAKSGDILITSANGSTRLVGKHAIIKDIPNNSAVPGGFMLLATAKNPQFVNSLMSAPWYSRFISLYVAGGNGAIGNLNKNDLDEQNVLVPKNEEQKNIGQFFSELDNLIILHQRKRDEEKRKKKALMQLLLTGIVRTV